MGRKPKEIWAEERNDGTFIIVDGPATVVGRIVQVENSGAHRKVTEPDPNQAQLFDDVDDDPTFDETEDWTKDAFVQAGGGALLEKGRRIEFLLERLDRTHEAE